ILRLCGCQWPVLSAATGESVSVEAEQMRGATLIAVRWPENVCEKRALHDGDDLAVDSPGALSDQIIGEGRKRGGHDFLDVIPLRVWVSGDPGRPDDVDWKARRYGSTVQTFWVLTDCALAVLARPAADHIERREEDPAVADAS